MDREELIEIVRQYKIIYDQSHKMYSDADKKEMAWREIGRKLNQPADACKQQWNNLRDSFRRTLKRRKTASGQASEITKIWKFESEMEFLKPFIKERERATSAIEIDDICPNEEETCVNEELVIKEERKTPSPVPVRTSFVKKKPETASSVLMKYLINEKKSQSVKDDSDELDLFFASVAKTVKRFTPLNRALAKRDIIAVISEFEIQELKNEQSYQVMEEITPTLGPSPFSSSCESL